MEKYTQSKKHGRKLIKFNMEKTSKYKILLSKDALADIREIKKYILTTFKYREYAENFSGKIKKAI